MAAVGAVTPTGVGVTLIDFSILFGKLDSIHTHIMLLYLCLSK